MFDRNWVERVARQAAQAAFDALCEKAKPDGPSAVDGVPQDELLAGMTAGVKRVIVEAAGR